MQTNFSVSRQISLICRPGLWVGPRGELGRRVPEKFEYESTLLAEPNQHALSEPYANEQYPVERDATVRIWGESLENNGP